LDEEKLITALKTQGNLIDFSWLQKYEVIYLENGKWTSYDKVSKIQSLFNSYFLLTEAMTKIIVLTQMYFCKGYDHAK